MVPVAKILLPVDFSERSVGAVHCAQRSRSAFPEIICCTYWRPCSTGSATRDGGVMLGDLYRAQLESLTLDLEQFQQAELAGCNVRRLWWTATRVRIIEFAHDEKVDLIMMPTTVADCSAGSFSAPTPPRCCMTWSVPCDRRAYAESATRPVEVRHVLCAVDLGSQSERA